MSLSSLLPLAKRLSGLPLVVVLVLMQPTLGFQRATRDSGQSGDLVGLTRTLGEAQAWNIVSSAPDAEKAIRSQQFVEVYPQSKLAGLAHYFIASSAFTSGQYNVFLTSARAALARFPALVQTRPLQSLRWLSLLSLTGFYLAETGASDEPQALATQLLRHLDDSSSKPPNLSELQWELQQKRLRAAAHYVLGRVHLTHGANPAQRGDASTSLQQARREFEETLKADPMDPYANYRLGNVLEARGDREAARKAFARAALAGGPVSELARQRLLKDEKLTEGESSKLLLDQSLYLERALQLTPRSIFLLSEGVPHPVYWWDGAPEEVRKTSLEPPAVSNILRGDYAGPDSCKPCHEDKHRGWSGHPHRWMNAMAGPETVKGDFSGTALLRYKGGVARFGRHGSEYRMTLSRGQITRSYLVRRTIGSRFFQYYVGRLIEGPEGDDHETRLTDHVLPFGYWFEPQEWVPVVHINLEVPDEQREDPFLAPSRLPYDRNCSPCHTTRPFGDWMMTTDGRLRLGAFSPYAVTFKAGDYLFGNHRDLVAPATRASQVSTPQVRSLINQSMNELPAETEAVTLGVSCEACHNGARDHVRNSTQTETRSKPLFFPSSEHLLVEGSSAAVVWGRNSTNINWICARCHSGSRPRFAGGMDTWNSTEYSDAVRGFCYSPESAKAAGKPHLTCVQCHDPHFTIGQKWSRTPAQDDARCQSCHEQFSNREAIATHSRHPPESEGSRCMNCHMPRLNEGLQDVVRTHQISSPTNRAMIEANQPAACNLCHLDKGIGWTSLWLKDWYGASYDSMALKTEYRSETHPVGLGWLESAHEATRLVGAAALLRRKAWWALPELLQTLDDPYLINRQFGQRGLEQMLGIDLRSLGYRFYLESEERAALLPDLRTEVERRFGTRIKAARDVVLTRKRQQAARTPGTSTRVRYR